MTGLGVDAVFKPTVARSETRAFVVPWSIPAAPPTLLKVAVTAWTAVKETEHDPVPVQARDQPAKVEPDAEVAVRLTRVPLGYPVPH